MAVKEAVAVGMMLGGLYGTVHFTQEAMDDGPVVPTETISQGAVNNENIEDGLELALALGSSIVTMAGAGAMGWVISGRNLDY